MSPRPIFVPPMPRAETPTERQICDYIAEMCAELRQLARRPKFRTINYLLDMARLESEKMAKDLPA